MNALGLKLGRKAKSKSGGAGPEAKGAGAGPREVTAKAANLQCRICGKKLGDKSAHPNGRFCQKPPEAPGPKAKCLSANATSKEGTLMFEESDNESEPQAEEELSPSRWW